MSKNGFKGYVIVEKNQNEYERQNNMILFSVKIYERFISVLELFYKALMEIFWSVFFSLS